MYSQHTISIGHEFIPRLTAEEHGSQTEYILSFIVKGSLKMRHRGEIELSENMITLVPAGMAHSLIAGESLELWWLSFCPSCLGLNEDAPLMRAFRQVRLGALPALVLDEKRLAFFSLLLKELQQELTLSSHEYLPVYQSYLTLILHEINKAAQCQHQLMAGTGKVVAALDYIQQHYLEPISLKDVARAVHSSPSHLATLVKQDTGYSIGQWIGRHRLTQACSSLLHTKKHVSQIVEELGWSDTTHFIRQFKKAYGITPAAWRKKQLAKISEQNRV